MYSTYFKCYSFGLSCLFHLYGSYDLFDLSDSFCSCSVRPDSSCRSGWSERASSLSLGCSEGSRASSFDDWEMGCRTGFGVELRAAGGAAIGTGSGS